LSTMSAKSENNVTVADASETKEVSKESRKDRIWWLDWLRTLGVYLVVLLHICLSARRAFRDYEDYNIIDECVVGNCDTAQDRDVYAFEIKYHLVGRFFLQWGIPGFIYLSGLAAYLSQTTIAKFYLSRLTRLLLPTLFGYFACVVPTLYLEQVNWWLADAKTDNLLPYGHLFVPYMRHLFVEGGFLKHGFHWLYFLIILIVLSSINGPWFFWWRHNVSDGFSLGTLIGGIIIQLGMWLFFIFAAGFEWYVIFLAGGPYVFLILTKYVYQKVDQARATVFLYSIVTIPTFLCATMVPIMRWEDWPTSMAQYSTPLIFYNAMYLSGFMHQHFDQTSITAGECCNKIFRVFLGMFVMLGLAFATVIPDAQADMAINNNLRVWAYSFFGTWEYSFAHCLGTWLWTWLVVLLGQVFMNEQLVNKSWYRLLVGGSIIVYVSHWVFANIIVMVLQFIQMPYVLNVMVMWPGSIMCSLLVYWGMSHIPGCGYLCGVGGANPLYLTCEGCCPCCEGDESEEGKSNATAAISDNQESGIPVEGDKASIDDATGDVRHAL